jgi:hypothetical protein
MPECLDYENDPLIGNFGTITEFKMHYSQQIDRDFRIISDAIDRQIRHYNGV